MLIPELFQFTHIFNPIILLRQAALHDRSLYTDILSDPHWSRLSLLSWILSLTQTAALLQSSVVLFLSQLKVFHQLLRCFILFFCLSPKGNRSLSFLSFSFFGQRPITVLFHFTSPVAEWAKEDPRGAGIFYLSDFESSSSPMSFFLLSWWNFRMLQQFLCVCVKENSSHRAKTIQSYS